MEWITLPEAWVALATLTLLEIVLGIDNIVFISVLVGRLAPEQRRRGRVLGLAVAMGTRIALLLVITSIMRLRAPVFSVFALSVSVRDLILLGGGLFLIAKATLEIHESLEGAEDADRQVARAGFTAVIAQIAVIDIVFSLDSVITAVGMANYVVVMIIAIVLAVGVMMLAAGAIGRFVDEHPTMKMLALSFLVLIGVALIGEGVGLHIPKGYIYFAMAFSLAVEMLNLRVRRHREPIHLHKRPPG